MCRQSSASKLQGYLARPHDLRGSFTVAVRGKVEGLCHSTSLHGKCSSLVAGLVLLYSQPRGRFTHSLHSRMTSTSACTRPSEAAQAESSPWPQMAGLATLCPSVFSSIRLHNVNVAPFFLSFPPNPLPHKRRKKISVLTCVRTHWSIVKLPVVRPSKA